MTPLVPLAEGDRHGTAATTPENFEWTARGFTRAMIGADPRGRGPSRLATGYRSGRPSGSTCETPTPPTRISTTCWGRRRDRPAGALLFTCNGRGSRTFSVPDLDAALVSKELGDVPLAGFFCAGEVGQVGGRNLLHGFTASLALFYQRS